MNKKEVSNAKTVEEKKCPLNVDLKCEDCRWYEIVETNVYRCKVDRIIGFLFSLETAANVTMPTPSMR